MCNQKTVAKWHFALRNLISPFVLKSLVGNVVASCKMTSMDYVYKYY